MSVGYVALLKGALSEAELHLLALARQQATDLQLLALQSVRVAMWLSGPSKTADIEQALVIGAHGARSCTVLVTPS